MKSMVKMTVLDNAIEPRRAYDGDAGMDIAIQEDITIYPGDTVYAHAGVKLDIPDGMLVQVITRSSTFKKHVTVVPSIIDSNYHDEISTIVSNFNPYPVTIKQGTRLAQMIIMPYYTFTNEPLPLNQREHGKFGSSDKLDDTSLNVVEAFNKAYEDKKTSHINVEVDGEGRQFESESSISNNQMLRRLHKLKMASLKFDNIIHVGDSKDDIKEKIIDQLLKTKLAMDDDVNEDDYVKSELIDLLSRAYAIAEGEENDG